MHDKYCLVGISFFAIFTKNYLSVTSGVWNVKGPHVRVYTTSEPSKKFATHISFKPLRI